MAITPTAIMPIHALFLFGATIDNLILSPGKEAGSEIRLEPCPSSPNCVSSLELKNKHFIAPLSYAGKKEAAYQTLVRIIASEPRARIVTTQTNYIRAEFKSRVFGFVDDIEFFFSSDQPLIHVRSASRMGYYDFGVNRKRIEGIRKSLNAGLSG